MPVGRDFGAIMLQSKVHALITSGGLNLMYQTSGPLWSQCKLSGSFQLAKLKADVIYMGLVSVVSSWQLDLAWDVQSF